MAEALPAPSLNWALFLDVDHTVLDAPAARGRGIAERELIAALASLYRSLEGAVALLSGRPLAELDRLLAPLDLPAAGQHGAELRLAAGGDIMRRPRSLQLQTIRDALELFAVGRPSVLVEDRGLSLIAHFRGAARSRPAFDRAVRNAVGGSDDLEVIALESAFDIKPRGFDEGLAVEWLMRTSAFRHRLPIFVGDRKADRGGFLATKAFGGQAIRVGEPLKRVAPPRSVRARDIRKWLVESAAALAEQQDGQRSTTRKRPAQLLQR